MLIVEGTDMFSDKHKINVESYCKIILKVGAVGDVADKSRKDLHLFGSHGGQFPGFLRQRRPICLLIYLHNVRVIQVSRRWRETDAELKNIQLADTKI